MVNYELDSGNTIDTKKNELVRNKLVIKKYTCHDK
jgi:hypothetical protein